VIGPSGSGKSTIMRSLNQLISNDSGTIDVDGTQVRSLNKTQLKQYRSEIGMVFQNYNLVGRMTALENVLHGALGRKGAVAGALGFFSNEEKEKALDYLQLVGLGDFALTRADELSGGQKQRVGIARALMQEPKVILADEPIASLDPKATRVVMDYLYKIAKERGITVVANLHQVDVAKRYSDRIIGIKNGRVRFVGTPETLTNAVTDDLYGDEEVADGASAS
jgi:phosphonate transport system ATP-binding protein